MGRIRRHLAIVIIAAFAKRSAHAADYFVNSTGDAHDLGIDGVCDATGGSICTLRAAVEEAEAQAADDAIWLPSGIFSLTLGPLPLLDASGDDGRLSITGNGYAATRLRGCNYLAGDATEAAGECRLIELTSLSWLLLRDLSIEGFHSLSFGGAILGTDSTLTVERCYMSSNSANDGGGSFCSSHGSLIIRQSAFAYGAGLEGGEINVQYGSFSCDQCIFEAATSVSGGAVCASIADVRIDNSLFADDAASINGGAIISLGGTLKISNSTFQGNHAGEYGGAIYRFGSGMNVYSSTITDNRADDDLNGSGEGGGIYASTGAANAVFNSILSGNLGSLTISTPGRALSWPQDCAGDLISNGYNIVQAYFTGCGVGDDGCCSISGATLTADPQLGALVYNGGSTRTMAIGPGSPAIDTGDPAGCSDGQGGYLSIDQRGAVRPAGGTCDLGAFEYDGLLFDDDFELWESKWSSFTP